MITTAPAPTLTATLDAVVGFVRRLPTAPSLSANAASVLHGCAVDGPLRISAIADRLGVSQPGATQIADRMVRDGLVRRRPDPQDRRVVLVEITRAGRHVFESRRTHRAKALEAALDQLNARDQQQIRNAVPALDRLTRTLDDHAA